MSFGEPDGAADWRLPGDSRPPLLGELVERIDEALATARASEAAVMTVGAAALDAAEQARRAAELAERASAAMNAPGTIVGRPSDGDPARPAGPSNGAQMARALAAGDGEMDGFTARADRVAERLRRLQRLPLSA